MAASIIDENETQDSAAREARFADLDARWRSETQFLSDPQMIVDHPAFREVVAMGIAVVPLLLRELESGPNLWVWALPEITGDDPIMPTDSGNISRMSETWIRWGRQRGLRW